MMSKTDHFIVPTGTTAHSPSSKLSPHYVDHHICFKDVPEINPSHASTCCDTLIGCLIEYTDIPPFDTSKCIDLPPPNSSVYTDLPSFDPSIVSMNNNTLIGRRIVFARQEAPMDRKPPLSAPAIITADCPGGLEPDSLSRRGERSINHNHVARVVPRIRGRRSSSLPRSQVKEQRTRVEPVYKVSESYAAIRLTVANREYAIMDRKNISRASDNTKLPRLTPEPKSSLRRSLTQEQPKSPLRRPLTPNLLPSTVRHSPTPDLPSSSALRTLANKDMVPSSMKRWSPTPSRSQRKDENTLVSKTLLDNQRNHEQFQTSAPLLSRACSVDFWDAPPPPDLWRQRTTGHGLFETKPSTQRPAVAQDYVQRFPPELKGTTDLKSCLKKPTHPRANASDPESIRRNRAESFQNAPTTKVSKLPADVTGLQLIKDINFVCQKEQYVQLTMSGAVVLCSTGPSMIRMPNPSEVARSA